MKTAILYTGFSIFSKNLFSNSPLLREFIAQLYLNSIPDFRGKATNNCFTDKSKPEYGTV